MERKLATKRNGVASQPRIQRDAVDRELREGCSLGPALSPARNTQTRGVPVTVSSAWIAWWLNLRLE